MNVKSLSQFVAITIILTIGLGAVIARAYRSQIAKDWESNRCDPSVVPISGFFKPADDPRTASEFARDNWSYCQKEYIQNALRVAAKIPADMAKEQNALAGLTRDAVGDIADVFFDLWKFCYEAYGSFMKNMTGAAKLFQNFMIQFHSIMDRVQASALSITYGLISLITAFVNSVQVIVLIAVIVVGVLLAMMIILFFLLLPISGLIVTTAAIISVVVVSVTTAVAAAMVKERFVPGACFKGSTLVRLRNGTNRNISTIQVGDLLAGEGRVTAVHRFKSRDTLWDLFGIHVTGDHLVRHPSGGNRMIPVREHTDAVRIPDPLIPTENELWCLTTTTRRIPAVTMPIGAVILFADWEEIPAENLSARKDWYSAVWKMLNGTNSTPIPPSMSVLDSEAGMSPDTLIATAGWFGRTVPVRVDDIDVGTKLVGGAKVIGRVEIAGDEVESAVELPGVGVLSIATWLQDKETGLWMPSRLRPAPLKPGRWIHLYTDSGVIPLAEGYQIRDASDVGLERIKVLVEDVVLPVVG